MGGELIDNQLVTGRDGDGAGADRNSLGGGEGGWGGGGRPEGEREGRMAKTVTKTKTTKSLSELGLLDSASSGGRTWLFGEDVGGEGDGLGWLAHTKP